MYAGINHELLNRDKSFVFKNIGKGSSILRRYLNLDPIDGDTYYYPGCDDECLDNANRTIFGSNYIFKDGRCFKAAIPCSKYDCLDKINLNSWPGPRDDSRMFTSCDKEFDTRQTGTLSRFVRIEKGDSLKSVAISYIEAYDIFGNFLRPIAGRALPEMEPYYGDNLLLDDISKYAMTTNVENAFIQIDLGDLYNVFLLIIVNSPEHQTNIYGNNVLLIDDDNNIVFKSKISHVSDLYVIETKKSKVVESFENKENLIAVDPIHEYPDCIQNGCLDRNQYTIAGYTYLLDNNRCLKNIRPCIQCLDNTIDIKYFESCRSDIDTRISTFDVGNVLLEIAKLSSISSFEVFYYDKYLKPKSIMVGPRDTENCKNNLIDGNYNTSCTVSIGDFIQASFNENTLITDIHISTKNSEREKLYGSALYALDKNDTVLYNTVLTSNTPVIINGDTTTFIFNVNGTGNLVNSHKSTSKVFQYPSCVPDGCLSSGKQIPGYFYYFPDGRCAKAVTDCSDCLDNVNNRTVLDNNTASCSYDTETRTGTVYGRYIKIIKKDGTGFNLSDLTVKNFRSEYNIIDSVINPVNNNLYGSKAYDKQFNTYASVKPSKLFNPNMLFDLGSDYPITDVELYNLDNSLVGADVYIISSTGVTQFLKSVLAPLIDNQLIIKPFGLTEEELKNLPQTDLRTTYIYPECIENGCLDSNNLPKVNQLYQVPSTNTCYIPKTTDLTCMPFNSVKGTKMDQCYTSCVNNTDTRFPPATGRYIRINNTSNNSITVNSLKAFDVNGNEYNALYTFAKNSDSGTLTNINIPIGSYFQIDLGDNKLIAEVSYSGTNIANNSTLLVYKSIDNNKPTAGLVSSTLLTLNTGSVLVKESLDGSTEISITESFNYPSCYIGTTLTDCLSKNKDPKPFFKYTFDDGRCVISKNNVCPNDCMSGMDARIISSSTINTYFDSCNQSSDTRFPPLKARYVKIQSIDNSGFNIGELYTFDNSTRLIESNKYGYNVTNLSNISDNNILTSASVPSSGQSNTKPFIEVDYGSSGVDVTSVQVKHIDNTLIGKKLYLLDTNYRIIYQTTLTTNELYLITPISPETITNNTIINTFQYPECSTYCLTNGNQIENQQYMINGLCYKAINNSPSSSCLNNVSNLYGASMDACFSSCSTTSDTRYSDVNGKYIRITNKNNTDMSILSINGLDANNSVCSIQDTYSKGGTNIMYRSDNLLSGTIPTTVTGNDSYIQIALTTSSIIKKVRIVLPTGSSILGSVINILDSTGNNISEYIITNATQIISNTIEVSINKNRDGTTNLLTLDTFSYPSCITGATGYECVSSTGISRENIKYNLPDNRCAISKGRCTLSNCMSGLLNNQLSMTGMNNNFISCDSNRDTRFPSSVGRYVRIQGTAGFTINQLKLFDNSDQIISPIHSMAYPLINNSYSKYMLDSLTNNDTIVGDPVNDADGTIINPFAFIDLGNNTTISKIIVNGTFSNVKLYVINTDNSIVYQTVLSNNTNTVYPISIPSTTYDTVNTVNSYSYTGCASSGCVTDDGTNIYHIPNQIYKTVDNRCLKAIGYQNTSSCLNTVNTLYGTDMDSCFSSCLPTVDTRYSTLTGRFIRLVHNIPGNVLQVSTLQAYETASSNVYPIVTKHCQPYSNTYSTRSDVLNTSQNVYSESTGYIQIDLGTDYAIGYLKIKLNTAAVVKVIVINSSFFKVHESVQNLLTTESIFQVSSNVGSSQFINIIERFNYTDSTLFDGSLSDGNKPKLLYEYTFINKFTIPSVNISVKCKNSSISSSLTNIMDSVKNNTLSYSVMDTYFASTSTDIDTRFPHGYGNYLRIDGGSTSGFTIGDIIVTKVDSTSQPDETIIWPKKDSTFSTSNCNDVTPSLCTNPFIQLYYSSSQDFTRIVLTSSDFSTLNNCKISTLDANGNVTSLITLVSPITGIIELLNVGSVTYPSMNLVNTFRYSSCASLGCTPNNYHLRLQKYQMDDNRCFKTKDKRLVSECLNNVDTLTRTNMDSCFDSCYDTYDSRYRTAVGRFIRLIRTDNGTNIKLVHMAAYSVSGNVNQLTPVMAHAKPVKSPNYSENMLSTDSSTFAEADGSCGTTLYCPYLQLDLGSNRSIASIKLIAEGTNSLSLNGTKILIIKEDGTLTSSKQITGSGTSNTISNIEVTSNETSNEVIDISEIYSWPCNTQDCINSFGKTKKSFKYTGLPNNRCLISKNICTENNCINNIIDYSQPVRITLQDFDSCDSTYYSQLTTVTGRYIRIRRLNPYLNPIKINKIRVFNKTRNLISSISTKTFVKPFNGSYGSNMLDDVNDTFTLTGTPTMPNITNDYCYIQLDLGFDMEIGNIEIISSDGSIANAELLVVNNLNNIVYRLVFTSYIDNGIY